MKQNTFLNSRRESAVFQLLRRIFCIKRSTRQALSPGSHILHVDALLAAIDLPQQPSQHLPWPSLDKDLRAAASSA
jgi:hypothetical protein